MSVWFDRNTRRWRIRIRRRGREARETLPSGTTREQAQTRHTAVLREFVDEVYLERRQRRSISEALTRLIEDELPGLRTSHHVLSNIRALQPYVAGRALDEIGDVAGEYVRAGRSEGLAPATINRRLAVLRRIANLAWKSWHWLDRPIAITTLAENNARHEFLSRGEIEFLAWAAGLWLPLARLEILCAAYTGLRRGELWALEWRDLDRDVLVVRKSKTGRPRLVPIVDRIRIPLRAWVRLRKARPHPRTMHAAFQKARATLVRPGLRFHDLRHSIASMLIQAGVPLYTVGEILGHTDKRTTARYAHLAVDNLRVAMDKIAPADVRRRQKQSASS